MKKYLSFLSIWLINSVVIYLAGLLLPDSYVLGSHLVSFTSGALISGLFVTLFSWAAKPIASSLNMSLQGTYKMFVFYWLSNTVAVWLIARFAPYTGIGITAYYWAVILGLLINIGQWSVWQVLKKFKLVAS